MKRPKIKYEEIITVKIKDYEALDKYAYILEDEIKELKELLQYVANEHLCGTPLIEGMRKQGIEYNK